FPFRWHSSWAPTTARSVPSMDTATEALRFATEAPRTVRLRVPYQDVKGPQPQGPTKREDNDMNVHSIFRQRQLALAATAAFTFDQTNGAFADEALTVDGGPGADTLFGGDGNDLLIGGPGNDSVDGKKGADTALLGTGNDVFVWDPGEGSDVIAGGPGTDTM